MVDFCDECGREVDRDADPFDYGYASDGALLCVECLDLEGAGPALEDDFDDLDFWLDDQG